MAKATIRVGNEAMAAVQPETPNSGISDNGDILTDAKGRTIKVRSLSVLEEMRLLKMLGEYNSSYYSFCSIVARAVEIDGVRTGFPNSEREIEALAGRLGKEGIAAIMESVTSSSAPDDEQTRAAVKNS